MEVILLEKISGLGKLGQRVRVKPGFARNFLIPTHKALPATEANLAEFEAKRLELEKIAGERFAEAKQRADRLEGVTLSIAVQANEEGQLFGSVGTQDIVRALSSAGHEVAKTEVHLPHGALRALGEYDIQLHLQGEEVISNIKLSVIATA